MVQDQEISAPLERLPLTISIPLVVAATVLLNEQNSNMALKVADYAYVLETGNLTLSGTGAELLANEQVKAAYLGRKRTV